MPAVWVLSLLMERLSVDYGGTTYPLWTLSNDHIGAWHRGRQFYEMELLSALRDLRLDGHYLDVGAHIGNHSVFFRACTRADKVTAFEPNPMVQTALARNATLYDFDPRYHAVHDDMSALRLVPGPDNNVGMTQALPFAAADDQYATVVPAMAIDALNLDEVTLIKIDVEGAECAVLRSAQQTIHRCRPVIVTEAATHEAKQLIEQNVTPLGYREAGCYCATPTYIWKP